jgi:KaiC/GvpD/RAD55 family RecA-like ATPase
MDRMLTFGIPFLDDAFLGISPNDLVLLGAPSGVGKTDLCCTIANANIESGRRVSYIALEAEDMEIERRLKFRIFSKSFYLLPPEIRRSRIVSFDKWCRGAYLEEFSELEEFTTSFFEKAYAGLGVYYKTGDFGVSELVEIVASNAQDTDLIIVDHVHYFDYDDRDENKAIKEIAKTARVLALEESKPIILVSHLRKPDKFNQDLVSGLDEFHGSSDLTKICTKVISIAPGSMTDSGQCETYIRLPKNRSNGSVTRYMGRVLYDPRTNTYSKEYKVGLAGLSRRQGFEELAHSLYPEWARSHVGSNHHSILKG